MGDGRKAQAPCGHLGEVVIGTYVQCQKCDRKATPTYVDPEKTEPLWRLSCPGCGSFDIEEFEDDIDAAMWFIQHQAPSLSPMPPQGGDFHCWKCGKVFSRPT